MRILDILLGRTRPVQSKVERLFAISTAYLTLTADQHLEPGGRAGVCFRSLESGQFEGMQPEMEQLLQISGKESGMSVQTQTDSFGFQWVTLQSPQFEDLVATIHLVSLTLQDHGYADRLLAAVFKFLDGGRPVYWIYNYKRGCFYPFVPRGQSRERDNAAELRLKAAMQKELPIESDLERWYPMWDIPL